jgi:hypothetical protein
LGEHRSTPRRRTQTPFSRLTPYRLAQDAGDRSVAMSSGADGGVKRGDDSPNVCLVAGDVYLLFA